MLSSHVMSQATCGLCFFVHLSLHARVRVSRHVFAAELQQEFTLLASPSSGETKACCSLVTACILHCDRQLGDAAIK